MKALLLILFSLILISNIYGQEEKQEHIIKIEKFGESTKIIQSPMQPDKTSLEQPLIKKQEKIVIEKPKAEPITKKIDRKIIENSVLKKAWESYEEGKYEEASNKFFTLIESQNRDMALSARLGLAYSLKNQRLFEEALKHFQYLYKIPYREKEVLKNIVEILIKMENYVEAEQYALSLSDEEGKDYLNEIHKGIITKSFKAIEDSQEKSVFLDFLMKNERYLYNCLNPEIFFNTAQKLRNFNEYEASKKTFEKLLPCNIEPELRLGILYELSSLISEKDKSSPEMEKIAKEILKISPQDITAKTLLAWHYYNGREYEKALNLFSELYQKEPKEEYLLGIAYCYNDLNKDQELIDLIEKSKISSDKLNLLKADAFLRKANRELNDKNYSKAFSTIKKLSKQSDTISKQKAAEWYCKEGFSLLASHVDSLNNKACYWREQFPSFQFGSTFRFKSGDQGLSKLSELTIPFSLHYPIREGKVLSLRLIPKYVNSGSLSSAPYVGKYYRYLNGEPQKNSPITSKWLFQPEIFYEIEGYPHILFSISSTPLNGTVSPMLLFSLNLDYKNFYINLHQNSTEESILSIQGQKDPYSSSKWGRVIKTGINGGINFDLSNSYWLTISGEFDYIWGKNVWENYYLGGNISIGKTILLDEKKQFDIGAFFVVKHFNRNSNFFTYGHGGYFSPQIFTMLGPTFRYQVKECCGIALDIKASLGYIYYRNDSSPHYPKFSENLSLFGSSALGDLKGYYESEKKSKFGGSFEISGRHNITKNISIYVQGKGNISGSYNEWSIGGGLRYYFIP